MSALSRIAAAIGALVGVAGCIGPDLSRCSVQCGAASECPSDQVCLADNFCHGSSSDTLCGAEDGGPEDAGPDAAGDAGPARPPLVAGELIVTEIMKDPCATDGIQCTVADVEGEWFEIHNPTADALELEGVEVEGENDAATMDDFTISSAIVVAPGGHVVLALNADMAINGGIEVDYTYPDTINLANNGADRLILRSPVSPFDILDQVTWSDVDMYPDDPGLAMSLDRDSYDDASNDLAASWCSSSADLPTADQGSPGARNPGCP